MSVFSRIWWPFEKLYESAKMCISKSAYVTGEPCYTKQQNWSFEKCVQYLQRQLSTIQFTTKTLRRFRHLTCWLLFAVNTPLNSLVVVLDSKVWNDFFVTCCNFADSNEVFSNYSDNRRGQAGTRKIDGWFLESRSRIFWEAIKTFRNVACWILDSRFSNISAKDKSEKRFNRRSPRKLFFWNLRAECEISKRIFRCPPAPGDCLSSCKVR